jgi:hypothetical protein
LFWHRATEGKVFPWLAESLPILEDGVTTTSTTTKTTTTTLTSTSKRNYPHGSSDQLKCPLPHANASPLNNRCGKDNTHMYLPPEPDAETRALIEAHNQVDLAVYEAAVKLFALQQQVLSEE